MTVLWTPERRTTRLWFDASDAGSFTLNSGYVEQWNDKSGNSGNATATGTARPSIATAVVNGLNAVWFASPNMMTVPNVSVTPNMSAFQVVTRAASNVYSVGLMNNSVNYPFTMLWANSQYVFTAFGTNSGTTVTGLESGTGAQMVTTQRNSALSKERCWINGNYRNQGAISNFYGTEVFDRLGGSGSYKHNGHIAEFVLVNTALTDSEREQIEGYLAHKWGITLPVGHTYYSDAPTVPEDGRPIYQPVMQWAHVTVAKIGR